jgi:hypothetical protein
VKKRTKKVSPAPDSAKLLADALAANERLKLTPPVVLKAERNAQFDATVFELAKALRANADAVVKLIDKLTEKNETTIRDCIVFGRFTFDNKENKWCEP